MICWSLGSCGNSASEINKVREVMNQRYRLTDQGHLEYYLGVEVIQPDANTLTLHQSEYINPKANISIKLCLSVK